MCTSGTSQCRHASTRNFTPWVLTLRPTSSDGLKLTRPAQLMTTSIWPLRARAAVSSMPIHGSVMSPSRMVVLPRSQAMAPSSPSLSRRGRKGSLGATLS